jgi:3-deoxy-D-manno-octulosonic-acid transferase
MLTLAGVAIASVIKRPPRFAIGFETDLWLYAIDEMERQSRPCTDAA